MYFVLAWYSIRRYVLLMLRSFTITTFPQAMHRHVRGGHVCQAARLYARGSPQNWRCFGWEVTHGWLEADNFQCQRLLSCRSACVSWETSRFCSLHSRTFIIFTEITLHHCNTYLSTANHNNHTSNWQLYSPALSFCLPSFHVPCLVM